MYSLTFRLRVATPAQYGRNGMASLHITLHTPNLHVYLIAGACVLSACAGPGWLLLDSATHFHKCCHSNASRAPIANPPNSAQLGGIPYHSPKLPPGPCNSAGMRPRTDTQMRVTTIDFSWSSTHAKCNYSTISKFDWARFLLFVPVFVSHDLELGGVPASTKKFFQF